MESLPIELNAVRKTKIEKFVNLQFIGDLAKGSVSGDGDQS